MENRKADHIALAYQSQINSIQNDSRFDYEPLLHSHADAKIPETVFLGKKLRAPIWISSMTGGTQLANKINQNLARAAHEFGLGMGLGSCRCLLDGDSCLADFNVRPIIGDDLPLYANIGISQIEKAFLQHDFSPIHRIVDKLKTDGLIIHINPLQEAFQPEGDMLSIAPIDLLNEFIPAANYPIIVKEVGQGMGPQSLLELSKMNIQAIDFGAFGGTNFSKLELLRNTEQAHETYLNMAHVGHSAIDMLHTTNRIFEQTPPTNDLQLIVSGGIPHFLDGYYAIQKSKFKAVYGQGSALLSYAKQDYASLQQYLKYQIRGLELAFGFLRIRKS